MKYMKYMLFERYHRSLSLLPILTPFILPPILTTIFFDFHCKDEEMETQRGWVPGPRPQSRARTGTQAVQSRLCTRQH